MEIPLTGLRGKRANLKIRLKILTVEESLSRLGGTAGFFNFCCSRKGMTLLIILLFLTAGIATGVAGVKAGAMEMVLFGGSLGKVPFPHFSHHEALSRCDSCHNLFPQTAGAIQELIKQDKLKKKEVMNQCTKCHKELVASNKKSGPITCMECHQKGL